MKTINPYLNYKGTAEQAFNLYKAVLGGEIVSLQRYKDIPGYEVAEADQDKLMHISLMINKDNILMATDAVDNMGEKMVEGNNFSLSISADSEAEADRIFKELAEGGVAKMPMQKTFWGAYFGMLNDRFGIQWMVSFDEQYSNS